MKRSETAFDVRDLLALVFRSRALLLGVVGTSCLAFLVASFVLPKRYKASGTVAVQADYFRFPLIEEFLPSPTDPAELLSRRDALVRSVFSNDYLAKLGEKHGLLKSAPDSLVRGYEIEELFRRFEIFSVSQTVLQVNFTAPTAAMAQAVVDESLGEIVRHFREERLQKIARARDNILQQTERLNLKEDPTKAVLAARQPEVLRAELAGIEGEIAALSKSFSAKHPDVLRLEKRAAALRSHLAAGSASAGAPLGDLAIPQGGAPELYQGLVKKLAYLNIAYSMESDARASLVSVLDPPALPVGALWPRKPLFLVWGFLFGLVLASLALLVREAGFGARGRLRDWSAEADLPVLGEIPALSFGKRDVGRVPPTRENPKAPLA
jgi:uncharacterized protein involved in exopolysaccharide biosynthesis